VTGPEADSGRDGADPDAGSARQQRRGPDMGPQTLRCFIAVDVGEEIRGNVEQVTRELRPIADDSGARLGWTRPEGWHVTLAFLGAVARDLVADVSRTLDAVVASRPAVALVASGLVGMPSLGNPRVVAVAVEDPEGHLAGLARCIRQALEPSGFVFEERPFRPHLTLARVRRPLRGRDHPVKAWLAARAERALGSTVVDEVGLYESQPGPGGSRYRRLHTVALAARGEARQ
jgi:2'-5' RNA ligase